MNQLATNKLSSELTKASLTKKPLQRFLVPNANPSVNTDFQYQRETVRYVTQLMLMLGFSPRHLGFSYIREMIMISLGCSNQKLGNIYAIIAEQHSQPAEAVQTAVRTALKTAQLSDGFRRLEDLVGAKFIEANNPLAPREFLGIIVEYLCYVWDGNCDINHY